MTGHKAQAERRRAGHSLWWAQCSCGWATPGTSKQDAEHRAVIHENVKAALALVEDDIACECYDVPALEFYGDGPCVRCELRQLLGGVA